MFILDKPYVSEFLKRTVLSMGLPVLDNEVARSVLGGTAAKLCSQDEFVRLVQREPVSPVYCNSENAIGWIQENLASSGLPEKIELFKDKFRFRDLLHDMCPEVSYRSFRREDMRSTVVPDLTMPFVIKPSVGFFSIGVHKIETDEQWYQAVDAIEDQATEIQGMYPAQVVNMDRFIAESFIEGDEYAVDAYYGADGRPVILNILKHLFASGTDVSDRVYITSASIIKSCKQPFTRFLEQVGRRAHLANFPVHVEFRVDSTGHILPVEVNPMRFAGWCVADLAYHAYGINSYECFLAGNEPNWDDILRGREGKTWAVIVADVAAGIDRKAIESVDYDAFMAHFSNPVELRRIDYSEYPVWAFLFAEADEADTDQFETILRSDLTEFLRLSKDSNKD